MTGLPHRPGMRRGVSLLPSLFTVANIFCGWSCVVYALRGELETAAPFIGVAIVLDMLDGRIARMTGTTSEFGVQLDSLADIISFGMAPAVLAYAWGLAPLGRLGWAAGFLFVTAAALRLARFNIQKDRKSTRLNSSHSQISYAVFCLKKKKKKNKNNSTHCV